MQVLYHTNLNRTRLLKIRLLRRDILHQSSRLSAFGIKVGLCDRWKKVHFGGFWYLKPNKRGCHMVFVPFLNIAANGGNYQ
jgi:hypothetical protein